MRFPARYTHVSEWASWQANLRATFASVPLNYLPFLSQSSTMSSALFKTDLVSPPADVQNEEAMHCAFDVASKLCTTMPNVYPNENARGKVFQQCLGRAFGNLLTLKLTSSTGREARPGSTLSYRGACLAFIEYKNESGHDGDALCNLHATTRSILRLRQKNVLRMAIQCSWLLWSVCIVHCYSLSCLTYYGGIHFYVLGGFRDVSRTVVEPLARPCTMVLDSGECESELAQLLYSLRKTITRLLLYVFVNQWLAFPLTECLLERIDNPATTVQQHSESTPRIYGLFEMTRMPRGSWSSSRSSRPIMKGQCNSW